MSDFILAFSSPETSLARAGGKGANLAALTRGGFHVPPGFVVTTEAYRAFVESQQIQSQILARARAAATDDPAALERASSEIRALFDRGEMPNAMGEAIVSAYRELASHASENRPGELPVAVRSSATAEDLPGLAFAGQQETYLNVVGEPAVTEAVKQCWASLWTARAIAYRARNGIAPDDVALAAVVQVMVPADSSGVLFTANPLTGRRDQTVVDASFGLGEAVVAGQVEPDHYVVDTENWQIVERRLGEKAIAIVPQAGGGTRQITRDGAGEQALPDARIVELAQTARRVAEMFGAPQDIEWAYADHQLYLLQARPITSLYPVPANPFPDPGLRLYFSLASIQGVTDPLTPLGTNALQMLVGGGVIRLLDLPARARDYLLYVGDRLYIDVTDLARDPRLRNILSALFVRGDPGALPPFRRLLAEGRIPVRASLTRRRVVSLLPRVLPLMINLVRTLLRPERGRARATATLVRLREEEGERVRASGDLAAVLGMMRTRLPILFERLIRSAVTAIFPAIAGLTVLDGWVQEWLGERKGLALELMRGLPGNVTTEMDLELWRIAQEIRSDPAAVEALRGQAVDTLAERYKQGSLPGPAQRGLARFLDEYGMRATAEIDLGRPRWRDDPTSIISTLLNYLELRDPQLAPDAIFARGQEQADKLAVELVARVRRTRSGRLRAWVLRAAIRRMRILGGLRESPKLEMVRALSLYREALLERARELAARGALERAEDIFFVPFDTLERFAGGEPVDLKRVVSSERAVYERERGRRQIPRLLLSTGEAFYEGLVDEAVGRNELAGDPVSPGVAEGPARVILDPRGARLEPGEILVCPATDPGWTPLFLTAGGLVMEIGGLVTHGSVVAREYGIPAVVGVHDATRRLASGQRVRVDGNRGRVTVLE